MLATLSCLCLLTPIAGPVTTQTAVATAGPPNNRAVIVGTKKAAAAADIAHTRVGVVGGSFVFSHHKRDRVEVEPGVYKLGHSYDDNTFPI